MGPGPADPIPIDLESSGDGAHTATLTPPPDGRAGAPPAPRGARRRRRLIVAGALLVVVAAVVVVLTLVTGSSKPSSSAGGVPPGETTTSVTRRTLRESATLDGTLGYGSALELYDRLSGTYTWLPAVGATVGRGGTLFRVNDLPVVLMYGSVPAYRALKEGVSAGPDVLELNENLVDLGYDPYGAITDEETFSEATAEAVRRFQHAEGLTETGELELGRIDFAPSARRITAVHVTLGQDPKGGAPKAKTPSRAKTPSKAKKPSSKAKSPSEDAPSKTKTPAKDSPSKGDGEDEAGAPAEAVLSTTSTQQLVALKLKPEQQQLVHVGQRVPVALPGGTVVGGHVIAVGSVASESKAGAEPGSGEGGASATIPATVALDRVVAHLDEAPVSLELVKAVRRDVLAVPATALTAVAGGGYAIEALEGGRRIELPVTLGMFADGYVQVEGAGVREGLTVLESE